MDCLVLPVQNKLEEWKKVANTLDKDHAKGKLFVCVALGQAQNSDIMSGKLEWKRN
jgi:hypothetical protein